MIKNKRFDVPSKWQSKSGQSAADDDFKNNADLLNELNRMLESSTEESFDSEAFERRLEQLQQKAPVMEDFDAEAGLKRLKEEHFLFFENSASECGNNTSENHKRPRENLHSSAFKEMFKPVVAAVLVVAVRGVGVAYAAGVDVFEALAEWTMETFNFTQQTEPAPGTSASSPNASSLSELQDALDEYGITEKLAPTYIPEGYKQTEFYTDNIPNGKVFVTVFESGDNSIIINIRWYSVENNGAYYQKDGENPETYEVDGISHYIMTNMEDYRAAWVNGSYEVNISGLETKDELRKIIDSIYER